MNEIRVWDRQEQRMIYPEEAAIGKNLLAIGLHGLPIAVDQDSFKEDQSDEIIGWNVDHRMVPMQFIGLKDEQGKKAYEGDIVQFLTFIGRGVVDYVAPQFQASKYSLQGYDFKVIGNIYENPELILQNEE